MTADSALIKNVLTQLTKNVLSPLGLTSPASITDAASQKKFFGSGTLFNSFKRGNGRYYENSYMTWRIRITDESN